MNTTSSNPLNAISTTCRFAVGIDVGSEKCALSVLRPDKSMVIKPFEFSNDLHGYTFLSTKLQSLEASPAEIGIGLEATGPYWETLYYQLATQGYSLMLLHPSQTHQFAQRRGLRAKTDRLDATTIARVLLSGEARVGYVPDEQIASYRELVRLHTQLSDELARDKNDIQGLLVVLFPDFTHAFPD